MASAQPVGSSLAVGVRGPEVVYQVSRTDFARYAGASGDFNPMHHDEEKAAAAGQPSVFGHGMLSMGILGRALTDFVGVEALRDFRVRFTQQVWPGDTLVSRITVTRVDDAEAGRIATMDCELVNQDGGTVVAGTATVRTD